MAGEQTQSDFGEPVASTGGGGLFEVREVNEKVSQTIGNVIRDAVATVGRGGLTADQFKAEDPLMEMFTAKIQSLPDTIPLDDGTNVPKDDFVAAATKQAQAIFAQSSDAFYGIIADTASSVQSYSLYQEVLIRDAEDTDKIVTDFIDGHVKRHQDTYNAALRSSQESGADEETAKAAALEAVTKAIAESDEAQACGKEGETDANDAVCEANEAIARIREQAVDYNMPPDLELAIGNISAGISQIQDLKGQLIAAMSAKPPNLARANMLKGEISHQTKIISNTIDAAKDAIGDLAADKAESYSKAHEAWLQKEFGDKYSQEAIAATAHIFATSPALRESYDIAAKVLGKDKAKSLAEGDVKFFEHDPAARAITKEAAQNRRDNPALVKRHEDILREITGRLREHPEFKDAIREAEDFKALEREVLERVDALRAQAQTHITNGNRDAARASTLEASRLLAEMISRGKLDHQTFKDARLASLPDDLRKFVDSNPELKDMTPDVLRREAQAALARKVAGGEVTLRDEAIIHLDRAATVAGVLTEQKRMNESVAALLKDVDLVNGKEVKGKDGVTYDVGAAAKKFYESEGIAKLDAYKSLLEIQMATGKISKDQYGKYSNLINNPEFSPQFAYLLKDAKDPESYKAATKKIDSITPQAFQIWADEEAKNPDNLFAREPKYKEFYDKYFNPSARAAHDTITNQAVNASLETLRLNHPHINQAMIASGGIVTKTMYDAVVHFQNKTISPQELDLKFKATLEEATIAGNTYKAMVLSQLPSVLSEKERAHVADYLKSKHDIDLVSFDPSDPKTLKKLATFDISAIPKLAPDQAEVIYAVGGNQKDAPKSQAIALHKLHQTFEGSVGFATAINSLSDRVRYDRGMGLSTDIDRFFQINAPTDLVNAEEMKYTTQMQTIEMRLGYLKTQGLIKTPSQENFMRNVLDKFKGDDAKLKQVLTDLSVGTPEERATAVKTIQQTMMSGGRDGYSALYDTKIGQALKDIAIAFDVAYQKEVQHIPAAELTNPLAINQGTLSHESEGFVPSGVQLAQSNAKRAASKAANLAFEVELKKFSDPKDRLALVKAAAKSGVDIDYAVIHEHDPNARETLSKANTKLAEFATQRFNAIKEEEAKKDQSGDFRARYRDLETLVKAEIRKIKDVTSQQEDLLMQTIEASRGADGTLDPELLKTNLDTVSKTGQAPAKHQAGEARAGNDTLVGGADQSVKGTATAANDIVRDLSAGIPPSPSDAVRATTAAMVLKEAVTTQVKKIDEIAQITEHLKVAGINLTPTVTAALALPANAAALTPAALQAVQNQVQQVFSAILNTPPTETAKLAALEKTHAGLEALANLQKTLSQNMLVANTIAAAIEYNQQQVMHKGGTALTPEQIAQRTQDIMKAMGPERVTALGEKIAAVAVSLNPNGQVVQSTLTLSKEVAQTEAVKIAAEVKAAVTKHSTEPLKSQELGPVGKKAEVVVPPPVAPATLKAEAGPVTAVKVAAVVEPKAPAPTVVAKVEPPISGVPLAQPDKDKAPKPVAALVAAVTPKLQAPAAPNPADLRAIGREARPETAPPAPPPLVINGVVNPVIPEIKPTPTSREAPADIAKPKVVASVTAPKEERASLTREIAVPLVEQTPRGYGVIAAGNISQIGVASGVTVQGEAGLRRGPAPSPIKPANDDPAPAREDQAKLAADQAAQADKARLTEQAAQRQAKARAEAAAKAAAKAAITEPARLASVGDPRLTPPAAQPAYAAVVSPVSFNSDGKPELVGPTHAGDLPAPPRHEPQQSSNDLLVKVSMPAGVSGGETVSRGDDKSPNAAADPQVKKTNKEIA